MRLSIFKRPVLSPEPTKAESKIWTSQLFASLVHHNRMNISLFSLSNEILFNHTESTRSFVFGKLLPSSKMSVMLWLEEDLDYKVGFITLKSDVERNELFIEGKLHSRLFRELEQAFIRSAISRQFCVSLRLKIANMTSDQFENIRIDSCEIDSCIDLTEARVK